MTMHRLSGPRALGRRLGAGAALALALAGCQGANDRLLGVVDPDVINPSDVSNADAAVALGNGVLATFNSITGGGESTWLFGGLLVDEWSTSSTFIQNDETDQRLIPEFNSSITGMVRNLYRVRTRADEAIAALRKYSATSSALIGEMYLARGYAELQLASDFCNGIPIGNGNAVPPENGTPRSTQEVFRLAAASLDSAIAAASGTDTRSVLVNRAARVARGREANGFDRGACREAGVQRGERRVRGHARQRRRRQEQCAGRHRAGHAVSVEAGDARGRDRRAEGAGRAGARAACTGE